MSQYCNLAQLYSACKHEFITSPACGNPKLLTRHRQQNSPDCSASAMWTTQVHHTRSVFVCTTHDHHKSRHDLGLYRFQGRRRSLQHYSRRESCKLPFGRPRLVSFYNHDHRSLCINILDAAHCVVGSRNCLDERNREYPSLCASCKPCNDLISATSILWEYCLFDCRSEISRIRDDQATNNRA